MTLNLPAMSNFKKIKTVIIDDNEECINSLKEHLSLYPEIELQGSASHYTKAINLITKSTPDLVFLDVEMPGKNGFEILAEARKSQKNGFKVIFYTAYDQYMLAALRESAFDYILKPIDPNELRIALEHFKTTKETQIKSRVLPDSNSFPVYQETISIPTNTGIKFINKNAVVVFQCLKEESCLKKPCWKVMLNDQSQIKLRTGITANEILDYMKSNMFVQINQNTIVNTIYIYEIEFKPHTCLLLPPFDNLILTVSRTKMSEVKDKFDRL